MGLVAAGVLALPVETLHGVLDLEGNSMKGKNVPRSSSLSSRFLFFFLFFGSLSKRHE